MNINKLMTSAILAILCFVLFVYPDPQGSLYTVLRWVVFGLLIVILFQFSNSDLDKFEKKSSEIDKNSASITNGITIGTNIKDQYDQLLSVVFNMIQAISDKYIASFYILDLSGQKIVLQTTTKNGFNEAIAVENELIQTIMAHEEALLFQQSDIRDDWESIFQEKTWRGSECLLGIRIMYKNVPVGCMLIQTDHFSNIDKRDRDLLSNLGQFVSLGMMKLDNIDKLTMNNYYHYQIASLLNSLDIQSDVQGLFTKVRDICRTFFNYDKLTVTEKVKDGNHFKVLLEDGYKGDTTEGKEYSISGAIHGRPLRLNETILSEDMSSEFYENGRFEENDFVNHPFKSILAVPVQIEGNPTISIALEKQTQNRFSNPDQNLLELLSLTIGSIMSWQKQYWKMHENAIHDGLTNLFNHKAFMNRLIEEVSRADRYQQNMVLAMLDLDKFKRINDNYSHLYGDYVIRVVAEIIKESVRNIDIVGRYGGEEYAVLLINTDVKNSITIAQRIIEKIANYPFSMDGIDVRMTISCGLSEFPNDTNEMIELIAKADKAMYHTKANGGNLVTIYSEIDE